MQIAKFTIICLFLTATFLRNESKAQNFTDYIPAGFHTPFLKKGEFILSGEIFHDNNKLNFVSKTEDFSSQSDKSFETSIRFNGFLGISNQLTLGYSLFIFPNQTISEGIQENESNFHVNPNFTFGYRLSNNFEIFGTGSYDKRKSILGDRQTTTVVPIFDPVTGETTFEEQMITIPAAFDLESRDFSVRAGFVWRGRF